MWLRCASADFLVITSSSAIATQASFRVQEFQMAGNLDHVAAMIQWSLNYQLPVPQTDEKWGFGVIRDDWSARPATARWHKCQIRSDNESRADAGPCGLRTRS
jgi:hypothetical protein